MILVGLCNGSTEMILNFIRSHKAWAPLVVFVLAFGESLAFVSLLLPATVILLGAGGLVGASGIDFWPVWAGAAFGAALGDWVSYWLGYHYKEALGKIWPLSRHPGLLPRAHAFFQKVGEFWRVSGPVLRSVAFGSPARSPASPRCRNSLSRCQCGFGSRLGDRRSRSRHFCDQMVVVSCTSTKTRVVGLQETSSTCEPRRTKRCLQHWVWKRNPGAMLVQTLDEKTALWQACCSMG